jgi:predicted phage gp36 major capsid-like protein
MAINQNTRTALVKAATDLDAARAELLSAEAALKALSANRADAVMGWMKASPPPTQDQIHREMVAKEQERKLLIAQGKIPAPVKPAPIYQNPIDEVYAKNGKSSDVNRGTKRPFRQVRR